MVAKHSCSVAVLCWKGMEVVVSGGQEDGWVAPLLCFM